MKTRLTAWPRLATTSLAVATLCAALQACAPIVVGAAVGTGVIVATDRRTSATQLEDESIELKASTRLVDRFAGSIRVSVTSFNRRVLLTGEVPSEAARAEALRIVSGVENVKEIVDEMAVMSSPSFTARQGDTLTTGRVKAALVDADDLSVNAFKVVTERGTTYLMGRVTRREADRATEITRSAPGVQRVVRVFEIITEDELRQLQLQPAPASDARVQPAR